MTFNSWKTTEPEPYYVPPDEPDVLDTLVDEIEGAITYANFADLDAVVTVLLTDDDGSVVTVTKQSEKNLRRMK